MKAKTFFLRLFLSLACFTLLMVGSADIARAGLLPQGGGSTAGGGPGFTFQGRLNKGGLPYSGTCDFAFDLWDAPSGGSNLSAQFAAGVGVASGLFSVVLNDSDQFGIDAFNGAPRWLEVWVKCPGDPSQFSLGRQKLTAGPYTLTQQQADSRYLNVGGPEALSSSSASAPALTITQTGAGQPGIRASATGSGQAAGLYGTGSYAGVWGQTTGGYGVIGTSSSGGVAGWFSNLDLPHGGAALRVDGVSQLGGDVSITGKLAAPITRYAPITVGDLMISPSQSVMTGDSGVGPIFPSDAFQHGGTITFPLPADYQPGTTLTLDLYLTPLSNVASGTIEFWVRWTGTSTGGPAGTGGTIWGSPKSFPVAPADRSNIFRQTYSLIGFNLPLPEFVQLTIRREPADTYNGDVSLTALRLAYQAVR